MYGFTIVKNTCGGIKLFLVGLWKEFSLGHRFVSKVEDLWGWFLSLFLLIWLVSGLIVTIFSAVVFLTSWGSGSRIDRGVQAMGHELALFLNETVFSTGLLNDIF